MKTSAIVNKNPLARCTTIEVTGPRGLAPIMAEEIRSLGLEPREEATTVSVSGGLREAMLLNVWLRTANSVLMEIMSFRASDAGQLYERLSSYAWESLIAPDGYLSITANVDNPTIRDTRFASMKFKDAVVDRIKARTGRRPDSGPERRGAVLHLRWRDDQCRVYVDTSGEPLSKRGYRKIPASAPLKEGLAAALVLSTGWQGDGTFINPMCGSGTLAIEAALIALHRPPGVLRSNFGFMHIKGFDRSAWNRIKKEATASARKTFPGRIIATDIDANAVDAARRNARTAGVEHLIEFKVSDFHLTEVPTGDGVMIMNPPYGERLGHERELQNLYGLMGDFMKQRCAGKRGYIFSGNPALAKKIGLRTKSRREFYNGPIECRLLEYALYEGTRKQRD